MPTHPDQRPRWIRYAGLGTELVGAVVGLTLLGYWVDHHWGCGPWGMLTGLLIGLVGGMYNLIRGSLRAFEPTRASTSAEDREGG